MTDTNDIIYASAKTMAQAIQDKHVSAVELVETHLARIDEVNPALNAVVQLAAKRARAEAVEADAALARGESLGTLHGVPFTLKDSIDTEGVVTTGGTLGRKDYVPDADATVTARLRAAGAILLGKTNTPELTFAGETDNLVYGRTNNPFDLSRAPGGSSGGAGAIVCCGGAAFDIGSDTGGSVRGPAHYCGITGIKPNSGACPARSYRAARPWRAGLADAKRSDGAVCGGPGAHNANHIRA
ncbi:Glutamyl-tRNA(Gln) amidotransferase subunit A 2 [Geodia barretti]|uniref:Glutamyl-tRNA(Gln) amidotransferase subunit A 2 n=1 Tax=Geodia barretti TaxID=519541 RepID=A0AA35RBS1_GEOBA|nr:Glutamyl-tRNA(Gln) amidotransferase subunit A 2 [Geodia barretti]